MVVARAGLRRGRLAARGRARGRLRPGCGRRARRRAAGRFADAVRPALPLVLVAMLVGWVLAVVDPRRRPGVDGGGPDRADHGRPAVPSARSPSSPAASTGPTRSCSPPAPTRRSPGGRWSCSTATTVRGSPAARATARSGAELPPDTDPHRAGADGHRGRRGGRGLRGPWLPGQAAVRSVEGLRPAVDPATRQPAAARRRGGRPYRLSWYAPVPGPEQLVGAAVDPRPPAPRSTGAAARGGDDRGDRRRCAVRRRRSPPRCCSSAGSATTTGWPAATSGPPAAGTSSSSDFLTDTKTGTSEQFAAAYVLMARSVGIPARLVVGFRPAPGRARRRAGGAQRRRVRVAGGGGGGRRAGCRSTRPAASAR